MPREDRALHLQRVHAYWWRFGEVQAGLGLRRIDQIAIAPFLPFPSGLRSHHVLSFTPIGCGALQVVHKPADLVTTQAVKAGRLNLVPMSITITSIKATPSMLSDKRTTLTTSSYFGRDRISGANLFLQHESMAPHPDLSIKGLHKVAPPNQAAFPF